MPRLAKAVIAGLLTGIWGLSLIPVALELEEKIGLDILFKLRGTREPPSQVVMITMDKVSADKLKLPAAPEKWPRSFHARLTENLSKEGAAVIAFDILFQDPSSQKDDNLFAEAIRKSGNVVLCECLKTESVPLTDEKGKHKGALNIERLVPPIPALAETALALAPFPLPKVPVKVSQYWTIKRGAGDTPTMPVVVFQTFGLGAYADFIWLFEKVSPSLAEKLPHDKNEIIATKGVEKLIRILRDIFKNNPFIADKMLEELEQLRNLPAGVKRNHLLKSLIKMYRGPDSFYLNFYGPPGTIHRIPYYQVLQAREKQPVYQKRLDVKGKAVFVGLSELLRPEQKDGFHSVFSQPSGVDISGVEIAATAFANLLEDVHVQPLGFTKSLFAIFLWGAVLGIICYLFPTTIAAASVIGLSLLYLTTAEYQFDSAGSWYPLVIPLFFQVPFAFFGTVLWNYFDVNKERQNIRKAFGYYLPNNVVDQITKNISDIKSSGQLVYATCLFTDAERYTTLSESMEPRELHGFMNKYFEALFEPVNEHGGIVAEVSGDGMLAIWATPQADSALRNRACLAALNIASEVNQFNQSSDTLKLPTRMGLHSGYIFLGNVGAGGHYEYRPTGDIVNTASRIEGLNKKLGTNILVSEEVLRQIDGFISREVGLFRLAGKLKPVVIYELMGCMEGSDARQRKLCSIFEEALKAYRSQSWEEAIELFNESMKIARDDGPSKFYLENCKRYRANPPGEMWNGLVIMDSK